MSRTSYAQFLLMIEFMEKYGDLSKPRGGLRGQQWSIKKWKELTALLNSEGSGKSQNTLKWRKVWSDFKNNTKRKCAKINKSMKSTDGTAGFRLVLSDLETRVLGIIGKQAAVKKEVTEANLTQNESQIDRPEGLDLDGSNHSSTIANSEDECNVPGGSRDTNCVPPDASAPRMLSSPPLASPPRPMSPPGPKPTQPHSPWSQPYQNRRSQRFISTAEAFLHADRCARELEIERDRMNYEIEKERLRQRDTELQLQAQWLNFFNDALGVLKDFLNARR